MKKYISVIVLFGIIIAATIKNVSLIPEPIIMLMLGAGLIGLAGFGRWKFLKKS